MILKIQNLVIIITSLLMVSGCTNAQEKVDANNVLIVYLSRTKNTKAVAEMIQQNVGGKLVELELENPYPEDYKEIVAQVQKENEMGFLPPLKTKIDSIEK